MLERSSWLPEAQALAVGGRRRVAHDCGSGRTMIVDHKEDGWSAYCWRCSDHGWEPHPQESLKERIARLRREVVVEEEMTRDLRPPMPANFEPSSWHIDARVWLYKAGLTNDEIKRHGFYYHERSRRLVLPVMRDGVLVYWQARGFDDDRPKYINPEVDRSKLVAQYGKGDTLVLTEDILSAVRVSEVTEAWSILGTAIPDPIMGQIVRSLKPVLVWLDPDAPGRNGTRKAMAKLLAYGVDAKAIRTDRDPKLYSREEIANLVRPNCSPSTQDT